MSLANERPRRVNAGSKMSKLIDNEEEDEFYTTAYGGFAEIENDREFVEPKVEDHEEDYVDSDFDIDENEEPVENEAGANNEANEEFARKRPIRGVFTKAYKEPPVKQTIKTENKEVVKKAVKAVDSQPKETDSTEAKENKILRNTTAQKRKELEERQKERAVSELKLKKKKESNGDAPVREYRRLTQEELLAEAKITEEINLASLDAYQKLEIERKKSKSQKYVIKGPVIQYHSVTMPYIDVDEEMYGDQKEVDTTGMEKKQSRNFITFPDEETMKSNFDNEKPEVVEKSKKCAVTGLPAKYFDPLTNCPYANIFAFKKLREIYEIAKKTAEKNDIE